MLASASLALAILCAAGPVRAQSEVDALRRAARGAEARYERTARWLAPGTYGTRRSQCDETVGRFCLTFDSTSKPPTRPERREIGEARERALASQRALLSVSPGDLDAAGALVRLLVEAHRADEAVAAALSFAAATRDSVWGDWLAGYALHAAGRDSAASLRFSRALAVIPAADREYIESLDWLLSAAERRRVRRLPERERAAYAARFWRMADPMWLTAANEVWVEHVARHVEAKLLAKVPVVTGMLRWGPDLDQLTVRYGAPIARERDLGSTEWSFIEHFDTSALAYGPESMLGDGLPPLPPGEAWPLKSPSARSGHSPPAIRVAVPLSHQLTRFPAGDSMRLRLDAHVVLSSDEPAEALLRAWPWRDGDEAFARLRISGDSAPVTLEVVVPRDSAVYSAEVFETSPGKLHRARHVIGPLPIGPVQLSDVWLSQALPDSSARDVNPPALTSLLVPAATLVGVQVTVTGPAAGEPVEIEVSFARADSPSLLARAAAWAGRRLGIASESRPPRVRWQEIITDDSAVNVNVQTPARAGLYFVQVAVLTVTGEASSRRLIRVVSGS